MSEPKFSAELVGDALGQQLKDIFARAFGGIEPIGVVVLEQRGIDVTYRLSDSKTITLRFTASFCGVDG